MRFGEAGFFIEIILDTARRQVCLLWWEIIVRMPQSRRPKLPTELHEEKRGEGNAERGHDALEVEREGRGAQR